MSKFEINRMTIELIRAILRFHSSFLAPMSKENNIQILFSFDIGARKEERNLYLHFDNKCSTLSFRIMDANAKRSKTKKIKGDDENVKVSNGMKHGSDIKDLKSVRRKPFECSLCDSKFSLSFSLKKHIEKSHSTRKKTKSSLKTTEIRSSPNLPQISQNRYETFVYKGSFDCRICHTKFERNGALTMHIKTVHEGKKSWYCSKCKQLRYSERPELSQRQHAKIVIMKKHSQNRMSALGGVKRKILFFSFLFCFFNDPFLPQKIGI